MRKETINNKTSKSVDEIMHKENIRVKKLVDILRKRGIISETESKEIFTMEPFAQVSL